MRVSFWVLVAGMGMVLGSVWFLGVLGLVRVYGFDVRWMGNGIGNGKPEWKGKGEGDAAWRMYCEENEEREVRSWDEDWGRAHLRVPREEHFSI
jgi:hypothetical protein